MDILLTFFGVVAVGGAVLFLFLRRDRRPPEMHSLDDAPRMGAPPMGTPKMAGPRLDRSDRR
jgi:hypothetical protein